MGAIIVGSEKKILSLFGQGSDLGKITNGIFSAVAKSFTRQKIEAPARTEIKRRFELIMNHALMCRGDLKWGLERIVGAMDAMLEADANGSRWEPSERSVWVQQDGR